MADMRVAQNNYKYHVMFAVATLITVWFLNLVNDILFPFIISLVLAYLLHPISSKLERWKLNKTMAASVTLSLFALGFMLIMILIFPLFITQIKILVSKALDNKQKLETVVPALLSWAEHLDPHIVDKAKGALTNLSTNILSFFGHSLSNILSSGIAVAQLLSLVFIAPIVLFYFLRDWPVIVEGALSLIPTKTRKAIKPVLQDVHYTISAYVRGQALVCLIMGVFYAVSLSLLGLDAGLALGFISGILTFIPYVGAMFSGFLAVLIAALQFADFGYASYVLIVFIVGQFIEGNFIVPKLIGGKVNLHPVWVMFGLLAGGALFGFVGVLIALPLTAIAGVIIKHSLKTLKKSKLYSGA